MRVSHNPEALNGASRYERPERAACVNAPYVCVGAHIRSLPSNREVQSNEAKVTRYDTRLSTPVIAHSLVIEACVRQFLGDSNAKRGTDHWLYKPAVA